MSTTGALKKGALRVVVYNSATDSIEYYFLPTNSLLSWGTDKIGVNYYVNYGYDVGGIITIPSLTTFGGYIRVYNVYPNSIFEDKYVFSSNIDDFGLMSNRSKRELGDTNYTYSATKNGSFILPFSNPYWNDFGLQEIGRAHV